MVYYITFRPHLRATLCKQNQIQNRNSYAEVFFKNQCSAKSCLTVKLFMVKIKVIEKLKDFLTTGGEHFL